MGGSVSSADGALTVEVPAGALDEDTEVRIVRLHPVDWPEELTDETPALGRVYDLQPDGLTFNQPVTVTRRISAEDADIDLEEGTPLVLPASRSDDGEWELLENMELWTDDSVIVVQAQASHFSQQAAFRGKVSVSLDRHHVSALVGDRWTVGATVSADDDMAEEIDVELMPYLNNLAGAVQANGINDGSRSLAPGGTFHEEFADFECVRVGTGLFGVVATFSEVTTLLGLYADFFSILFTGETDREIEVVIRTGSANCVADAADLTPTPAAGVSLQATSTPVPPQDTPVTGPTATPGAYEYAPPLSVHVQYLDISSFMLCGASTTFDGQGQSFIVTVNGLPVQIGGQVTPGTVHGDPADHDPEQPVFIGAVDWDGGIYVPCPGGLGTVVIDLPSSSVAHVRAPSADGPGPLVDLPALVDLRFLDHTETVRCGGNVLVDVSGGDISVANGDVSGTFGSGGGMNLTLGQPLGGRAVGHPVRLMSNDLSIMSLPCPSSITLDASFDIVINITQPSE